MGFGLSDLDPTNTENWSKLDPTSGDNIWSGLDDTISNGLDGIGQSDEVEETDSEKAYAEVAAAQYNFARDLDFVRDAYKSDVDNLDSAGMKDATAGRSNVNAQSQIADARRSVASSGLDPSNGQGLALNSSLNRSAGDAIGSAQGESKFALDTVAYQNKENVIAQAMGDSVEAANGLGDIADQSAALAASKAYSNFNSKAATSSAAGNIAGAGLAYYGAV